MKARTGRKLAVATALTSVVVLAAPSIASASTSAGMEHFRIVRIQGAPGSLIIRGVYNDGGIDYSGRDKDLAVFPHGSFTIHHPGGSFSFSVNPDTCIGKISGKGHYTINNGYGVYRGVIGHGSYVFHGQVVLKRNSDGSCRFDARPLSEQDIVRASGPIST